VGKKVLGVLGTFSFLHILILYGVIYFLFTLMPQAKISVEEGTVVPPNLDGCFHIPEWYGRNLKNVFITLIALNRWEGAGPSQGPLRSGPKCGIGPLVRFNYSHIVP